MNLDHIHADFRHHATATDRERIDFVKAERWLDYEAAQQVIDTLYDLLTRPRIDRMPGLLIISDGFNGKTRILNRFVHLHGQGYITETADPVKPVILTQSAGSDEKRLLISILERFHAPYRATDNTTKLLYQVLRQCRACRVQMLMIDEMHEILVGPPRRQTSMLATLKLLSNELCIPIVGAGTREAALAIHMSDQMSSRFDAMPLPLWTFGKPFRRLLDGLERTLPLRKPSGLAGRELSESIYHHAGGERIGDTRAFIQDCAIEAIQTGQEFIDIRLVEKKKKWRRPTDGMRDLIS